MEERMAERMEERMGKAEPWASKRGSAIPSKKKVNVGRETRARLRMVRINCRSPHRDNRKQQMAHASGAKRASAGFIRTFLDPKAKRATVIDPEDVFGVRRDSASSIKAFRRKLRPAPPEEA